MIKIDKVSIKRFYNQYLSSYKKYIILAAIFMVIASLAAASIAYFTKPAIDDVFINKDKRALFLISFGIFLSFFIKSFATYFQSYFVTKIQENLSSDLKKDILRHYLKLNMKSIENLDIGKIITMLTSEIAIISEGIAEIMLNVCRDLVTCIALIIIIFTQDFILSLISIIILPIVFAVISYLSKKIQTEYINSLRIFDKVNYNITQVIKNIKTIKSYLGEKYEIEKANKNLDLILEKILSYKNRSISMSPVVDLIGGIIGAFVIAYGGYRVINNTSTAGSFFSFFMSLLMIYRPVKNISSVALKIQASSSSMSRIFSVLDFGTLENLNTGSNFDFKNFEKIEFKNVTFGYSDNNIIKNINLCINKNEKIAIIGESGSGKSTIANLLLRFYEINSGEIYLNDINFKSLKINNIRENISYVGNDSSILSDNVIENISYAKMTQTGNIENLDLIFKSLDLSSVDFLDRLDIKNLNNKEFSSGQLQRISFARGILKKSEIMILDEITSALDNISQETIKNTLMSMKKTLIIIAHRLNLVTFCDKIYIMQNGEIVGEGKHQELLENNIFYQELWKHQN